MYVSCLRIADVLRYRCFNGTPYTADGVGLSLNLGWDSLLVDTLLSSCRSDDYVLSLDPCGRLIIEVFSVRVSLDVLSNLITLSLFLRHPTWFKFRRWSLRFTICFWRSLDIGTSW
jgi:hypothetical protein